MLRAACCWRFVGGRRATRYRRRPDGRVTATRSPVPCTAMGQPTKGKMQNSASLAGGWWQTQGLRTPRRSLERCPTSSRTWMVQSFSPFSCSCAWRARLRSTSQTAVSLSMESTSEGEQPPWPALQRGPTCGATSGARSTHGEVWATGCQCGRSRRTPRRKQCWLERSRLAIELGMNWADAACKLVVLEHRATPNVRASQG